MKALTVNTLATPWRTSTRGRAAEEVSTRRTRALIRARRSIGTSAMRTTLKIIGTLHRVLYRWTDGRLSGRLRGGPVLLLTTTGRTTGKDRTWPLCYVAADDELVVIASARGTPSHPAWYRNLRAHPLVRVQRGGTTQTMVARTAHGGERTRLWERAVRQYPVLPVYQRKAGRELPVVLLRAVDRQAETEHSRLAA